MLHYLAKELPKLDLPAEESGRALGPVVLENVSRRSLLRGIATGGGLAVALQIFPLSGARAFDYYETGASDMPHGTVNDPHVYVAIAPDGTVSIVTNRSEMGQGSRTSLPMVVADEMEADWDRVKIVQALGDEPKYGNQDTDGSRSTRHFVQPMRQIGSAVRQMLEQAAAERWGVDPKLCRAKLHTVVKLNESGGETGETLGYGELAEAAMALPTPPLDQLTFKTDDQFRYMGKGEVQITDLHDITTGKAIYGADVMLPGMKVAVMARPPVVGGAVRYFDATDTLQIPGVRDIVELKGTPVPMVFGQLGGIAVVADDTWTAIRGRDALKVEWIAGPNGDYDTEAFRQEMSKTAKKPGKVIRKQGDPDTAFKTAANVISAEYYQPHMVHVAMEPLVAVARVTSQEAEVWAPIQSPYGARQNLAEALGLPIEKVTVHVTLLGGGFGRKSNWDYMLEAALVSQKLGGTPVKLQWTREDDIRHAFNHTTSVERIEAAVDDKGKVVGWRHNTVAPSILSTFAPDSGYQFPIEYGMGHVDMPFEIPNVSCENGAAMAHTRIGWFRSVSNIPRAFAVQSFACELAHALGRDQKEMLLELIGSDRTIDPKTSGFPEDFWNYGEPYEEFPIETARLKHVLNVAADAIGWGKELPKGEGLGLAVYRSFVSYVASAVHAKVVDGEVRVSQVETAVDCGFAVNPERIVSQMQGAAVMGMTVALNSAITYEKGAVVESNYHDYDIVRISNYPENVTVHIVPHPFDKHVTGVGEPGVPPFAPALYNAVFNATGKRMRALPIGDQLDS